MEDNIYTVSYWMITRGINGAVSLGDCLNKSFETCADVLNWATENAESVIVREIIAPGEGLFTHLAKFRKVMLEKEYCHAVPYILLQLSHDALKAEDVHPLRYMRMQHFLDKDDKWKPNPANYEVAYEGVYYSTATDMEVEAIRIQSELWRIFNSDGRPNGKYACSMSVSDINIINGIAYYVDSYDFIRLRGFDWESLCDDGEAGDGTVKIERLRRFKVTNDFDGMVSYLASKGVKLA